MTDEEQRAPARTKEFIVLMAVMMSIVAISIDAMLPALGFIGKDLQVANPNHVQYLIGGIFAGMAVGELISGPLSDALGRKKILYFGIGFYLLGALICYFAPSLDVLIAGRIIQGFGIAGPYISAVSIVRDKYKGREMARVMSIVMTIFILVPAIAPSLGQAILLYTSWRGIFFFYILYGAIAAIWIYFRLEETLPPERRIPFNVRNILNGLKEILRSRCTVSYTIAMGLCFGAFMGYLNSSQQVFQDQFGAGKMFTVYFGGLALLLGVASLLNSQLVERMGMRLLCSIGFAAVVVVSLFFLGVHGVAEVELWMFLAYSGVMFFCMGLLFGNLHALAMEPMGHIAGIAAAVIGSSTSIMSSAIGGVIGQFYNGTLIPMIIGFTVVGGVSWVIMLYASRNKCD